MRVLIILGLIAFVVVVIWVRARRRPPRR